MQTHITITSSRRKSIATAYTKGALGNIDQSMVLEICRLPDGTHLTRAQSILVVISTLLISKAMETVAKLMPGHPDLKEFMDDFEKLNIEVKLEEKRLEAEGVVMPFNMKPATGLN